MGNCSSKPKGSPRKGRKSGGTGRAAFSAVIPVLIGIEGSVETLVEAVVEGAVEAVVVDAEQAVPDVGRQLCLMSDRWRMMLLWLMSDHKYNN